MNNEPYRIGELDQRISIVRDTNVPDGSGGYTKTTATLTTVWAHARPRGAKEGVASQRVEGTAMYLFVIRNYSDVRESDRIIWNNISYNIRGILTGGKRNKYLEIEAERGVAQ